MAGQRTWKRASCILLAVALSGIVFAASMAAPPTLEVEDCLAVEVGTPVRVHGLVVDVRAYSSGTETVTLMDRAGGATLLVVCRPHATIALQTTLEVADLVSVEGEIGRDASGTIIFAQKGAVVPIARGPAAFSVELLCANWKLFEHDRFNVSGLLVEQYGSLYLSSLGGERMVTVRCDRELAAPYLGAFVTVDCVLRVDERTLHIYLWAYGVRTQP